MRRPIALAWICVLLLGAAAHTAYWLWVTQAVAEGFEHWAAERRAAGWTVKAGPGVRSGWPLRGSLTLPGVAVSGGKDVIPGGFSWGADHVTLEAGLLDPHRILVIPEGAQRATIAGVLDVAYVARQLSARLPLVDGRASSMADLQGEDVRLNLPGLTESVAVARLKAHAAWRTAATAGETALATSLDGAEIRLPPGTRWPLGDRIAALSLEAALSGPAAPSANPRQQVSRWADGGGTLDVGRLSLAWGPLGLLGRATIGLDGQLQPVGTGVVRLVGYAEAADMLATNGAMTRSAATAAKALLALLAQLPEEGGPAEVELPLTLRDRTLAARQFALVRLPVLTWTGP